MMISERWLKRCGRVLAGLFLLSGTLRGDPGASWTPPARLAETGLYADTASQTLAPDIWMYSPQYPLWSDGAAKRRWVYLPRGQTIDARRADNWVFPVGTKFWKEFSFGKRVETRLLEKTVRGWNYATYAWNADGTEAALVSDKGSRNHVEIAPGVCHDIPGVMDCKACHEGQGRDVVLGFNALQLSPDRDPLAPHAEPVLPGMINLDSLIRQGYLAHLPERFRTHPPRIQAPTPQARAALGYLWANCGGCHNAQDPLSSVGMFLTCPLEGDSAAGAPGMASVIGHASKFQIPGLAAGQSYRVWPGDTARSSLVFRMGSRNPVRQMPPLATKLVDPEALDLISRWIQAIPDSHVVEQR